MIFIAMGANLPGRYGSPEDALERAKKALQRHNVRLVKSSRTWITAPVPASDQPYYRNAVLEVQTELDHLQLLRLLHAVEEEFGRERGEPNAARTLDLDLLAYGDVVLSSAAVVLPHPRLHERGFVLAPLQEIAPEWRHPVLGKTPAEMMACVVTGDDLQVLEGKAA